MDRFDLATTRVLPVTILGLVLLVVGLIHRSNTMPPHQRVRRRQGRSVE